MGERFTERGAPGTGKTTRLIERANKAARAGKRVVFLNVEMRHESLRKMGLDRRVKIKDIEPNPNIPVCEQEAVEVS